MTMEDRIVKFIAALRAGGVRVSLAESTDAFAAVEQMGVRDREAFRISLRTTLVKEASDIPIFEELFPLFFETGEVPPLMDLSKDLTDEETNMLAEALKNFTEELRKMLEKLIRGEQLSEDELEKLSKLVGMDRADDLRYRDWMARRMEQALQNDKIKQAIQELAEMLEQLGMNKDRVDQMRQILQSNQRSLEEQISQYTGEQIADNMSQKPQDDDTEGLINQPFGSLSEKDMEVLRKEVKRLANMLRTRMALRQKRAKTGQLDAKATIRTNLKHGNVPISIKRRDHTLKPKVVAVCDISTSMRPASELMLNLLHAVQDQISKTHAFAFIDDLEYISPDFENKEAHEAVKDVMERMPSGYYNTDLGCSLETFVKDFLELMDSRTIFIVVGDGRNNYNDPRQDLFSMLSRRSRRTIWLNPEAPSLWGTGDSDMLKYASHCNSIYQVSNLAELTAAVDKMLT
jgi:uncharacterized protein